MLLPLFNQFKMLASKSSSRIPIIIAVVVLIFLTAIWHGRANMTDPPMSYVKGYVEDFPPWRNIWLMNAEHLEPDLPSMILQQSMAPTK